MSNSPSPANGAGTQDPSQNQPGIDGEPGSRTDAPDGWTAEYRHPGYSPRQVASLQREVRDLTAQLERKDEQLQDIVSQYERLLEERNLALAEQEQGTGSGMPTPLDSIRRIFDR